VTRRIRPLIHERDFGFREISRFVNLKGNVSVVAGGVEVQSSRGFKFSAGFVV